MGVLGMSGFVSSRVAFHHSDVFTPSVTTGDSHLHRRIRNGDLLIVNNTNSVNSSCVGTVLPFGPSGLIIVSLGRGKLTRLAHSLHSACNLCVPSRCHACALGFTSPVFRQVFHGRRNFSVMTGFSTRGRMQDRGSRCSMRTLVRGGMVGTGGLLSLLSRFPPHRFFYISASGTTGPIGVVNTDGHVVRSVVVTCSSGFGIAATHFTGITFSGNSLLTNFVSHVVGGRPLTTPGSIGHCFISPRRDNRVYVLTYILKGGKRVFFPGLNRRGVVAFSSVYSHFLHALNCRGGRYTASRRTEECTTRVTSSDGVCPIICFGDSAANRGSCRRFCIPNRGLGLRHFSSLNIVRSIDGHPLSRLSSFFSSLRSLFTLPSYRGSSVIATLGEFLPGFRRIRGKGGLSRGVWYLRMYVVVWLLSSVAYLMQVGLFHYALLCLSMAGGGALRGTLVLLLSQI